VIDRKTHRGPRAGGLHPVGVNVFDVYFGPTVVHRRGMIEAQIDPDVPASIRAEPFCASQLGGWNPATLIAFTGIIVLLTGPLNAWGSGSHRPAAQVKDDQHPVPQIQSEAWYCPFLDTPSGAAYVAGSVLETTVPTVDLHGDTYFDVFRPIRLKLAVI